MAAPDSDLATSRPDIGRAQEQLFAAGKSSRQKYAELVYYGLWFTPLREALDAFIQKTQTKVTGNVRVKLRKYSSHIVGRTSPNSSYKETLATYGSKDTFDQKLSKGFIDLWALPYKNSGKK